ncbi:MAG: DUF892 family protein [Flavitalea sp.]
MTQKQITRHEQVFAGIREKPIAKKCEAIEAIIKEGQSIPEETDLDSLAYQEIT